MAVHASADLAIFRLSDPTSQFDPYASIRDLRPYDERDTLHQTLCSAGYNGGEKGGKTSFNKWFIEVYETLPDTGKGLLKCELGFEVSFQR